MYSSDKDIVWNDSVTPSEPSIIKAVLHGNPNNSHNSDLQQNKFVSVLSYKLDSVEEYKILA